MPQLLIFVKAVVALIWKQKGASGIRRYVILYSGAPNGSVPQNICSSGTFLLAGRCGRNNSPWKESVAGKKIIQGVRGDLKSSNSCYGLLVRVTYHSRSELCPIKLPSKSGFWLGTLPSTLLGVRNR